MGTRQIFVRQTDSQRCSSVKFKVTKYFWDEATPCPYETMLCSMPSTQHLVHCHCARILEAKLRNQSLQSLLNMTLAASDAAAADPNMTLAILQGTPVSFMSSRAKSSHGQGHGAQHYSGLPGAPSDQPGLTATPEGNRQH